MEKIEIYSTASCPACLKAKRLLQQKSLAYIEYRVDQDENRFQEMKRRTDNSRTVPQIFIDGKQIGGFDRLWELEKSGKLDA